MTMIIDYLTLFFENEAVVALAYFALAFCVYVFLPKSELIKRFAVKIGDSIDQPEKLVYIERCIGFILLGLVPGILFPILFHMDLSQIGITFPSGKGVVLWWTIPILIFIGIYFVRPSKKVNISFYPQVRKEVWNRKRILQNSFFWILYLVGYEFMFRGLLFFSSLVAFGLFPAIAINCSLYCISHIPKGAGEAFGAFFMGILLCLIAYSTNSMMIPFVLHVILALGNDIKAIRLNKSMRFIWR